MAAASKERIPVTLVGTAIVLGCPSAMEAFLFRRAKVFSGTLITMLATLTLGVGLCVVRWCLEPLAARTERPAASLANHAVPPRSGSPDLPPNIPKSNLPVEIAEESSVDARSIEVGGADGGRYGQFLRYAGAAPEEELLRLLRHPNPVVRIYVSHYVTRSVPRGVNALYPLLRDDTEVSESYFDMGASTVVGDAVTSALCEQSQKAEVQAMLLRATCDTSLPLSIRGRALACVAKRRPQEGSRLAAAFLQDPTLRRFGVEALGQIDTAASLALLSTYVHDRDLLIRTAAAAGLAGSTRPDALSLLHDLLRDSDLPPRFVAARIYAGHPGALSTQLGLLLQDAHEDISGFAAKALASRPTAGNLKLLRPYLTSPQRRMGAGRTLETLLQHKEPRVRAFARRVLREISPFERRFILMRVRAAESPARTRRN